MANNQFGDFQTNPALAEKVVSLVRKLTKEPATVIEPTCGRGSFVRATLDGFPNAIVHGLEVQESYISDLERSFQFSNKFVLHNANYFSFDWENLISTVAKPIWVIGNPPWVTNTLLMKMNSDNLPVKSPQSHLRGYEAQTGKSNFDISESMIRDWFRWCSSCGGTLAVICKTSVARKVLQWWWKGDDSAPSARIHFIDAKAEFGAAVTACVLICSFEEKYLPKTCDIFVSLEAPSPSSKFGLMDGFLVSDANKYCKGRDLLGKAKPRWRSGIKHDAGRILELTQREGAFCNKTGEAVHVESDFLYPMLKGSDLARPPCSRPNRLMLVPQTAIGEDTSIIEKSAPRTWAYLRSHESVFLARKSAIYSKSGPFSIFGVGDYTFLPWKIAIGALYKKLDFSLIGPVGGKPVVFDDTVYFLGFSTEDEAKHALSALQSDGVQEFLHSMIFWDDMRPVKTEILNRINLSIASLREAA